MFDSFTPAARSLALVPARRGSIIAEQGGIRMISSFSEAGGGSGVNGLTGVPSSMHNSNAQGTAIVLLSLARPFERCHSGGDLCLIKCFVCLVTNCFCFVCLVF